MNLRWRCMAFLALFIAFFPFYPLNAQTQKEVQYIKGYLGGHEVQVTYREGGPVYGTFFFIDVHFCASGRYLLFGQSRKQTVLGNEQVNNWKDSGSWDVVNFQGHAALQYIAASGARDLVAMEVLPDGRVHPLTGASIKRLGRAQCK
jgi:hypothetical protein